MTTYPFYVRSLADEVGYDSRRTRSRWVLSVAGPFQFWPRPRSFYFRLEIAANQASHLLALPVRARAERRICHLDVVITQELRDQLVKKEYARMTKWRMP